MISDKVKDLLVRLADGEQVAGGDFVCWLLGVCEEDVLGRLDDAVCEVTGAVLRSDDAKGEVVLKLGFVKRWERRVEVRPTVSRVVEVGMVRRRMLWVDGNGDVFEADPAQEVFNF